jgi:outer membrane receptor protein involved in Fe transport
MYALPAWPQSAGSTIHGTVKDESGAAMPGVSVTIVSPALQVGQMVGISEADGTYRFGELPAGTYTIRFELPGFKAFVLDEFRLTIGFVARVDATMAVGGLEESITVTGASPVVDLTSTTTSVNLTSETLESIPIGRGLQQVLAMTPGVTTNRVDVGDSWMGVRAAAENYGQSANVKIQVDGIDVADGTSSGVYLTNLTLEEAQIRTSGNDAEVSVPGVSMVAVIKSGSNQFRGTYMFSVERPELQSSNLNDRLKAQGLSDTEPLRHLYDFSADLGGRIMRDKLWFYGAFVQQDKVQGVVGFASGPGPDGRYLTGDEPQGDVRTRLTHGALKVSYQPARANRLVAAWQPTLKYQPQGLPPEPNRFRPLESTLDYRNPSGMYKGEWLSTLSNRMVFNVVGGYGGYIADYAPWRSNFANPVVKGNPPRFDRNTTLNTGSNQKTNLEYRDKWQMDAGLGMFPEGFLGGQHELKTGTTIYWRKNSVGWRAHPAGNYRLIFDRGAPIEIEIFNSPTQPDARASYYAGYIKDTWRATDRLTLNLGLRVEQQRAFLPKQSKEASPDFPTLFPAVTYDKLDVLAWTSVVPRLGLAWDVGDKSVVKASFGRFANGMSDSFANAYNPLATVTMGFRWRDLDGNGDYTSGEINLNPNGSDWLSTSGASSQRLNRDLQEPMTTEATIGYEREVMTNLGVRVLYVFKKVTDQYATTNVARPRSAYSIPITRRDPGPDGALNTADDGGLVTIYDYDRAFFGAAFVQNELQNSDRDDRYQTIEFTVTKRTSGRWGAMASFWAIKNHEWLGNARLPDNPNNDLYPLNETWEWAGNVSGSYRLPAGVQFSGFVQSKVGLKGQRTNIFRQSDPSGPSLAQLNSVTMRLEPFGATHEPAIVVVNLRASKQFALPAGQRAQFDFDLFNLFNASAPITATFASGPSFDYATAVVPPRIVRIGFRYTF